MKENNENKIKEKQIPRKNYIKVAIYCCITMIVVLSAALWYKNYQDYSKTIPILRGKINEVTKEELTNFVVENENFYLYIGVASDENCREIENDLLETLTNKKIIQDTLYLNITNVEDKEEYITYFNDTFLQNNMQLEKYPAFLVFVEGKVTNMIQSTAKQKLKVGDVAQFLEENEIEGR